MKSADGAMATTGGGRAIDVPAAQFDWTSSGLVNPLDGKRTPFQYVFFICAKTNSVFGLSMLFEFACLMFCLR